MAAVKTNTKELGDSRVRVEVVVAPHAVQRELDGAASEIGREMKVPGFRKGKVPPEVVIRRVGRDAVLDEAVRESIGTWYTAAIDAARIAPVGEPPAGRGARPPRRAPPPARARATREAR